MLQMMSDSASSLPIPRFHHDPQVDSQGLYGYRIELLHAIDFGNVHQYYQAVKDALQRLHDAGFVMGDLHPGNKMVNEKGDLIFIDLAYAGKLGTAIPSYIPREFFASDVFHDKLDKERLAYFFTETGQSP
ncbi:Enoyl-(Acyl carrier protein) reductase [Teratosphaeria destructans]|uniref:Enoyl-(Acyl carrier protein) reductase n=1 Tax=Teratosphaeria destructans TaxID=418781 RepID=A0A9W7W3Z6_9PEZI|nr:Enoyl-(Acyl carrier protein) reductase [Teratosphaeria destructans]